MHEQLQRLTMYDVINDFLRVLDTNAWELERRKRGFDLVLVDEFHLFNKHELLVFQSLSRDPRRPPAVVIALDPRQSPSETFLGFRAAGNKHAAARMFDAANTVKFERVFRYTGEINALIDSLEAHYFGYELDEEDNLSQRQTTSHGPKPTLRRVVDFSRAMDETLAAARALLEEHARGTTVAVLCLDPASFQRIRQRIQRLGREEQCRIVDSRESLEGVATLGKRFVISEPEYVAGMQFDHVIIPDANNALARAGADQLLQLRRLLSMLYLAISRARKGVRLFASDSDGGPLKFLRAAIDSNVLELEPSSS
jgi:hypothetical protein